MVEVLVAIVILAFGMLGTVGMQAFAIQANRDARLQAQAVVFACTEIELLISPKDSPLPVLDSMATHAHAAAEACLEPVAV